MSQERFQDRFVKAASRKSAHFLPVLSHFQKRRSQDFISRPIKNTTAGMSLHCLIYTVLGNGFLWEDKKHRKPNVLCKVNGKTLSFFFYHILSQTNPQICKCNIIPLTCIHFQNRSFAATLSYEGKLWWARSKPLLKKKNRSGAGTG